MTKPNTVREAIMLRDGVPEDTELQRIRALPRRVWTQRQLVVAVRRMTAELKKPEGTQVLWPDQAKALYEIEWYGGIVGGIRVSGGKSLIAFLAASMRPDLPRPLLLCPSKSIRTGKIAATYAEAARHWKVRSDITWLSYELLQRAEYADYLTTYAPGMIIMDEAHHAGRYDSSRTKRIERFRAAFPTAPIILLSGSLIASRVVDDSQRLCEWALGTSSPLPLTAAKQTQRFWRLALEEPVKAKPGALRSLCKPEETTLAGVGRRYRETPGVCVSGGDRVLGTSLTCQVHELQLSAPLVEAFAHLREGRNPDGSELLDTDGHNTWLTAQTLALGFYYVPDPKPPSEWLLAYRNWAAYCREYVADPDNGCDTELQARNALINDPECWPLHEWLAVRDDFKLQRRAIWLCESRLEAVRDWQRHHKHGLVWVQFAAFGKRLRPYYGTHARDAVTRRYLTDHKAGSSAVASIKVCSEDLNLQYQFHQNLFVAPPATGAWHEQAIARTHRYGQTQPEITVDYWVSCAENADALKVARKRESAAAIMGGDKQRKLLIADWLTVHKLNKQGPQWQKRVQLPDAVMR